MWTDGHSSLKHTRYLIMATDIDEIGKGLRLFRSELHTIPYHGDILDEIGNDLDLSLSIRR